jgi:hypothetical protein
MAVSKKPEQHHESQPQTSIDERAIGDLVTAVEAHLPAMMEQLADLIGKTAPRVSARERQRLRSRMKRKMRLLIPAFAELQAVGAVPDSAEKWNTIKTAIRAILVEVAAPPRIRKSPDVDRLDWFVAMAAKATDLPRAAWARQPAYLAARAHIWNTLISVYRKVPSGAVQTVLDAWAADNDHRRYVHSIRLLTVAAGRFRPQPPQRIGDRAAVDLQNEYLRASNVFEQQLRLLTCLTRIEPGKAKPWLYWQQQNLNNLMEMASGHDDLRQLISMLDRRVRNALTHGPPIIERAARRCQFWDRDVCVTWTWEEYFHNTRALTLTVLGCANFGSFRQLIEIQILGRALAPDLRVQS